jgi:hypothetical protein
MSLKRNHYPIVLRFQGLFPHQLGRLKMHGDRRGGDLSHIDFAQSGQNRILMGTETWLEDLKGEIQSVAANNLKEAIAAKKARQSPTEAAALKRRGPVDPWAKSKEGPLREGILTVHAQWFGGRGAAAWDPDRLATFQALAISFLQEHFGEICVHARMDMDEEAPHIHFLVAPWVEKHSKSSGRQRLLQPSSNPLLASYENAQNLAGEHFAKLGLTRGEKYAEKRRAAKAANLPLPAPVKHVPPTRWRLEQKAQLKRVHEVLRLKQAEIAAARAQLQQDHDQFKATRAKLKHVWEAQHSIAAQTAEREAQIAADAKLLAALWQQAGMEVSPELDSIRQRRP